jgi:hypothetical protein
MINLDLIAGFTTTTGSTIIHIAYLVPTLYKMASINLWVVLHAPLIRHLALPEKNNIKGLLQGTVNFFITFRRPVLLELNN